MARMLACQAAPATKWSRIGASPWPRATATGSPDDVDRGEEADPHHVDEVPVDAGRFDGEVAVRAELSLQRTEQAQRDEDQATEHVRAVEAGEREERGGEDPIGRQEAEVRVLVSLAGEEDRAEDDRDREPEPEHAVVVLADRPHRELHRDARGHEDDRDEKRKAFPAGLVAEDR